MKKIVKALVLLVSFVLLNVSIFTIVLFDLVPLTYLDVIGGSIGLVVKIVLSLFFIFLIIKYSGLRLDKCKKCKSYLTDTLKFSIPDASYPDKISHLFFHVKCFSCGHTEESKLKKVTI